MSAKEVYDFMKEYRSGQIVMDGTQPFLPDVLMGTIQYSLLHHSAAQTSLRAGYARQFRNALTRLQATQYELLGKGIPQGESVAQNVTVKSFLKNLKHTAQAQAKG